MLKETKVIVFSTVYRPVLTYGCESWVLSRGMMSTIQAHGIKYLQRVKGETMRDAGKYKYKRDAQGCTYFRIIYKPLCAQH